MHGPLSQAYKSIGSNEEKVKCRTSGKKGLLIKLFTCLHSESPFNCMLLATLSLWWDTDIWFAPCL